MFVICVSYVCIASYICVTYVLTYVICNFLCNAYVGTYVPQRLGVHHLCNGRFFCKIRSYYISTNINTCMFQHKYYFFSTRLFDRRSFSSKDCFTGQSPGTMLAIYIPAAPGCAEERAKSKPVSLGGGWKSGVVGGAGDLSEDLTDGRGVAFEVVAAR